MSHESEFILQASSIEVASWSPGAVDAGVPPTQVHILLQIDELTLAMRLKSRAAADSLIAALIEHRDYVWPDKATTKQGDIS